MLILYIREGKEGEDLGRLVLGWPRGKNLKMLDLGCRINLIRVELKICKKGLSK